MFILLYHIHHIFRIYALFLHKFDVVSANFSTFMSLVHVVINDAYCVEDNGQAGIYDKFVARAKELALERKVGDNYHYVHHP